MEKITTTIKRQWLKEIIEGTKKIEYRDVKPYWTSKLARIEVPFLLRLIKGMQTKAPEVTLIVKKIRKTKLHYALHIGRVVSFKNWNKESGTPK